ncbi:phosphoethanolamine transferase [Helicobacter sp. 16-1353]|uniref:phosphoethanolamine transferase n=1 Tax=Helicobacter sp. 16-1353 TaxID=2004996 RepID=UPI00215C09DA|nr:phosphoethanolamine transferase [Helicobacter sp. 16-1353]
MPPKNLAIFSDVISPATHTDIVLKEVLTFSNYENKAQIPWYKTMNLIDIMKLAGYYTSWISNQEVVSIYGNAPETIARRSNLTLFTTLSGSFSEKPYDEKILPLLDRVIKDREAKMGLKTLDSTKTRTENPPKIPNEIPSENLSNNPAKNSLNTQAKTQKNFYIIHLMGTHGAFKNRYPRAFDKFTKDDIKNPDLSLEQRQIRAEYANAILYNDFIVSEIIKRFKDKNSLVFYFSDHGEEVYDFRDFAGHTGSMVSRFMVEIPFLVFMSDEFIATYPNLSQKIQNAKNKPFMSDDFIHALLDVSGIKVGEFESSRSLFSDDFNQKRIRMVYDKNYDFELRNQSDKYAKLGSRIWLHRVNSVEKLHEFSKKYNSFEIDTHFLHNGERWYFDVGHDGLGGKNGVKSINLDLDLMLENLAKIEFIREPNAEARIWLDFKNLNAKNAQNALAELKRICDKNGISYNEIIVESGSWENLGIFKNAGFKTSYYVPYYDLKNMSEKEKMAERARLKKITESKNVDFLSFYAVYYDFVKSVSDIDLLTWDEGKELWKVVGEKYFKDKKIKAVLVGESGKSHR